MGIKTGFLAGVGIAFWAVSAAPVSAQTMPPTDEIHMAEDPAPVPIDSNCLSLDKDCAPVAVDQAALVMPNPHLGGAVSSGSLGGIFGHSQKHHASAVPKCSLRSVDLDVLLDRIRQAFLGFGLPILKSDQSQRRAIVVTVQRPRGTGQQFYRALVRFDQSVACRVESSVYSMLQEPSGSPVPLLDDSVTIAVRALVQGSYRH